MVNSTLEWEIEAHNRIISSIDKRAIKAHLMVVKINRDLPLLGLIAMDPC